MSSLLKKLCSIYQNSRSQDTETDTDTVCLASFQMSTESVGSRRELVANSCTHRRRRRDETRQFRLVGVGGVYWALETKMPVCMEMWEILNNVENDFPKIQNPIKLQLHRGLRYVHQIWYVDCGQIVACRG